MSLKERITEDMKAAMRAGDKDRLGVIRLIQAAIKQREVDERISLDDAQVLAALEKMLKQRRDSVEQFTAAARTDLADRETFEIGVIEGYMPARLSDAELDAIVAKAIADSGAAGPKDMGKVIALVKPQVAGRADMGKVSVLVKQGLEAGG
ncbi:MAG TPA: GatB/YqeY domain-containing protein [Rhodanobacteraceae bacterium]|nr:GatB/YqeY domain-containing protein [Rhodanobacteraceae bacterium]